MKNINDFKMMLEKIMYIGADKNIVQTGINSVRAAINSNLILYKYLNITPINLGNNMYVIEIYNDDIGQFRIPISEEDFLTLSEVDFEEKEATKSAKDLILCLE